LFGSERGTDSNQSVFWSGNAEFAFSFVEPAVVEEAFDGILCVSWFVRKRLLCKQQFLRLLVCNSLLRIGGLRDQNLVPVFDPVRQ
jgi:hypothetical protein